MRFPAEAGRLHRCTGTAERILRSKELDSFGDMQCDISISTTVMKSETPTAACGHTLFCHFK
jgi:hypothetical protein